MKESKFEILKVYTIRWKKYRYLKNRVCYKDSIPLAIIYHICVDIFNSLKLRSHLKYPHCQSLPLQKLATSLLNELHIVICNTDMLDLARCVPYCTLLHCTADKVEVVHEGHAVFS